MSVVLHVINRSGWFFGFVFFQFCAHCPIWPVDGNCNAAGIGREPHVAARATDTNAHKTKHRTAIARGCGNRKVGKAKGIFHQPESLPNYFFQPIHQGLEFKIGKVTRIKKYVTAG